MPNPSNSSEENKPLATLIGGKTHEFQPVIDGSTIANAARIQAMDDIDEIKELIGRKGRVMIVDEEVTQRAKTLAKKAVKDNHLISSDDYRPQQDRYLAAYSAKFEEERKSLVQSLKCFPNAAAVELARKARTDKTQYNFPPSGKGPSHQRDLAVVSALHALGLSHNLEGDLEKIHDYADMYEEAVHSSEEVPWPPATF